MIYLLTYSLGEGTSMLQCVCVEVGAQLSGIVPGLPPCRGRPLFLVSAAELCTPEPASP